MRFFGNIVRRECRIKRIDILKLYLEETTGNKKTAEVPWRSGATVGPCEF